MTATPPPVDVTITEDDEDEAVLLWLLAAGIALDVVLTMSDAERAAAVERMIAGTELRLASTGQQLIDGTISARQWERSSLNLLKPLHLAATAALVGGLAALTDRLRAALRREVAQQAGFLRRFREAVQAGDQLLDGSFTARTAMYARAAHSVAQSVQRADMQQQGAAEERRVLGVADHCRDCLDAAARGWQPVGTLPKIGDSVCLVNCRCTFEYRGGTTNEAVQV